MRGITKFRCPKCGHIFEAPDIEDNASVRTMPQPCPRCGVKSNQIGLPGWVRSLVEKASNNQSSNKK